MKKTRIGIIGAGFVSQNVHLPCFSSDKRVDLVSICDHEEDLLNKVSKKYQIKNIYTDYKQMLDNEKLDGVVLAVHRTMTAKIAKLVIEKKIPLLTEKPAALNLKIASALSNLAKKKNSKYIVGYMKRNDNGIIYLKKILKKLKFGNLKSVYYESFLGDSYNNPFEYFQHKDKDYRKKNSLNKNLNSKKMVFIKYLNTFCHNINLIRYLFGKIKIDYKNISKKGEGTLIFKTKDNVNVIFNNQFSSAKKWIEKITINYDNGKVTVKLPTPLYKNSSATIKMEDYKTGNSYKPWIGWGWSFRNQAKAFVDYIKHPSIKPQNKTLCSSYDGLEDIRIVEKIFYK